MDNVELPEGTHYLVCGLRYNPTLELEGLPSSSIIILGAFEDLHKAVLCRDLYADIDTTMDAVTITSTIVMEEVPEFDVFLNFSIDEEGIYVRSQCVPSGTTPWLREEEDYFEALAYPEDKERMIEVASEWYKRHAGYYPAIIDDISGAAKELIE